MVKETVAAGKLIVLVGMPGSGKTAYMTALKKSGEIAKDFDDYQANAVDHSKNPRSSKHYSELLASLRTAKTVAVSDIRYCLRAELHRLLATVLGEVPEIELELRYFENNPVQCRQNIIMRNRSAEAIERELKLVDEYSPHYAVPSITMLKVYRPKERRR